jgi:hypothetical protein
VAAPAGQCRSRLIGTLLATVLTGLPAPLSAIRLLWVNVRHAHL